MSNAPEGLSLRQKGKLQIMYLGIASLDDLAEAHDIVDVMRDEGYRVPVYAARKLTKLVSELRSSVCCREESR